MINKENPAPAAATLLLAIGYITDGNQAHHHCNRCYWLQPTWLHTSPACSRAHAKVHCTTARDPASPALTLPSLPHLCHYLSATTFPLKHISLLHISLTRRNQGCTQLALQHHHPQPIIPVALRQLGSADEKVTTNQPRCSTPPSIRTNSQHLVLVSKHMS